MYRDAAAIRDYHELDYQDAEDPNALEKQLAEIESHLASNLSDVLSTGISSPSHHGRLIQLVSLMRFRVPAYKAYIQETLGQSARSVGKLMERHGKLPAASKPGASIMNELSISISNWKCLQFMFMLAADQDVLGILSSMKPTLLYAPDSTSFLTCDQPVALYHPMATPVDFYGVGIIDTAAEISLALSRRVMLTLMWPAEDPERRTASPSEVAEFNRRTIIMANSLVFSDTVSDAILAEVNKYKSYSAGPEHQVVDMGDSLFHVVKSKAVMPPEKYG